MSKGWMILGIILTCVSAGMFTGCASSGARQITPSNPLIIDMSEEPGATPPPAVTSPPAPAQSTSITANEQSYLTAVGSNSNTYSSALNTLSTLLGDFQIGSDEWTLDVAVQLAILRAAYDEAVALNPPSSLAHIHSKYIEGLSHIDNATYLIVEGIDNLNADKINQATTELTIGNNLINEATALVSEFFASHT